MHPVLTPMEMLFSLITGGSCKRISLSSYSKITYYYCVFTVFPEALGQLFLSPATPPAPMSQPIVYRSRDSSKPPPSPTDR